MPANPPLTRWTLHPCDAAAAEALARAAKVPEIVAELLIGRGITTAEAAAKFFEPTLDQLHDPYLMLGMREAVARIQKAVAVQEPILIYGDYDVDGTVATVLLKTALETQRTSMIGNNRFLQRRYAQGGAAANAPQGRAFSSGAWAAANPGKDVNAAIAAAKQQGYQVVQ